MHGMPMQVWKQTASDKDKSAVAGEIAIITIITIIGLNPETNERQDMSAVVVTVVVSSHET